jgi:hypothetical protein
VLILLVNIVVSGCVVSCRPHFNRRYLSNIGTLCHVISINIKSKNLRASISHPNQIRIKNGINLMHHGSSFGFAN